MPHHQSANGNDNVPRVQSYMGYDSVAYKSMLCSMKSPQSRKQQACCHKDTLGLTEESLLVILNCCLSLRSKISMSPHTISTLPCKHESDIEF